jgi:tetratricopeptide (TPR) repeat protein
MGPALALLTCAGFGAAATVDETIATAQRLASQHRYTEVIDLLSGLEDTPANPELRYIVAAELGRAYFHLGRYQEADLLFRRAVSIHPDRAETALYLEASAYLMGDLEQALLILTEIIKSGGRDLYLAVTLPGERRFLAEAEVWEVLEANGISMALDLDNGSLFGLSMGEPRSKVAATLGSSPSTAEGPALTAHAGPHLVWGFAFDDRDRLSEIVIHVENLIKYTPYRLGFGASDWRTSPAEFTALMGPTSITSTDEENVLVMSWERPGWAVSAAFGHPRPPRPPGLAPGVAMLRLIRIKRLEVAD